MNEETEPGVSGIEGYGDPRFGPSGVGEGPTGYLGPTGIATAYTVIGEPKGRQLFGATGAAGPYISDFKDGDWYAFRRGEDEFYARIGHDPTTGFLVLHEIPDPWICSDCGRSYQEGNHSELASPPPAGSHDFNPRGAP